MRIGLNVPDVGTDLQLPQTKTPELGGSSPSGTLPSRTRCGWGRVQSAIVAEWRRPGRHCIEVLEQDPRDPLPQDGDHLIGVGDRRLPLKLAGVPAKARFPRRRSSPTSRRSGTLGRCSVQTLRIVPAA